MSLRDELEEVYASQFTTLVIYAQRLFPSLDHAACEDLVQMAFMAALKLAESVDFQLKNNWLALLYHLTRNRGVDYMRRKEALSLEAMMHANDSSERSRELPGLHPRPSEILMREEKATRRRKLLSEVLAEYVAHCEKYQMHCQREVFERSLRGQEPKEIAAQMQLKPQQVFDHRSRAFERFRSLVNDHDPQGSVLASIFGASPADSAHVPSPDQLSQLVRWVVDEVGGLCPSDERLRVYSTDVADASVRDIDYHVEQSRWYLDLSPSPTTGCTHCRSRRDELA